MRIIIIWPDDCGPKRTSGRTDRIPRIGQRRVDAVAQMVAKLSTCTDIPC